MTWQKLRNIPQICPIWYTTAIFGTLPLLVAVGTNMSYVENLQLFPSGVTNERKVKGTWVQYAATRKQKVGMLQILLDAG